ncbi:MAG: acylneuraminate cytidylyltransferase family protein [Phycisphaerae bacterium]|jgi:CMP-N-acetylneuraminic acid synthetase
MTVVALIPARAGSKRLPNKNLANLHGRPLIAYTCEAALASGVLSAVYVNTDGPTIAAVAADHGVACPVLRPVQLARDDTPTQPSNRYILDFLADRGETYDAVMVLQPTSPLRTAEDIRGAVALYEENAPCAVVSASPVAPSSWLGHVGRDGRFEALGGPDVIYKLNGAIYVHGYKDYVQNRRPPRTMVYPMPAARGVDIDTAEDFHYAAVLLQRLVTASVA